MAVGSTPSSSARRFQSKGIIAWEVDGVLARLTKTASSDLSAAMLAIPIVEIGAALAARMRDRVQQRGELGDGQSAPAYGRRARYPVSRSYAELAETKPKKIRYYASDPSKSGMGFVELVRPFKNSRSFHELAKVVQGSYSVTGGMWQGLQARLSGQSAVMLDFQGRSEGTGKVDRKNMWQWVQAGGSTTARHPKAVQTMAYVTMTQLVQNRDKARAISKYHRVHVLMPQTREVESIHGFVTEVVAEQGRALLNLERPGTLGRANVAQLRAALNSLG